MSNAGSHIGRPRFGLSRHLQDPCLEVGPGISPFPVPPGVRRILAERQFEGSIVDLFPELGPDAIAPMGDVYLDLDTDGLRQFAPESLGSVVVSHVLEHTANPVQALIEINRTLRLGGTALIALPDRRFTFDRDRVGTTVQHLFAEYETDTRIVSDSHIVEFCRTVEKRPNSEITPDLIDLHRKRSIHVHCWTAEDFLALLLWLTEAKLIDFELVDFMGIEQSVDGSADEEFVYVLRKSNDVSSAKMAAQWSECLSSHLMLDPDRMNELARILTTPESMFLEHIDRSHLHFQQISLVEITIAWLCHRDLRIHDFPLHNPNQMIDWAILEAANDPRAAICIKAAVTTR